MDNWEIVQQKEVNLKKAVGDLASVLIAYSGGVDSSLLSYYGRLVLGKRATIVIAISPSLAEDELAFAREQSNQFQWELVEINTNEVDQSEYQRNDQMRCYFCKSTLFEAMHKLAHENGAQHLAYGANVDDLSDFRPGALAANQYRVLSPLQDAGLTKEEIRFLAKRAGLPSWSRPQAACLSSRFPTFVPITVNQLAQVDQAEMVVRRHGFRQVRVRHYDNRASIEVEPAEVHRLLEDGLYKAVSTELADLGYAKVTIDLAGYRQGSVSLPRD